MHNSTNSLGNIFYRLLKNIVVVFSWRGMLWQAAGMLLTWACVASGFDWHYFLFFHGTAVYALLFPSVFLGFFVPVFAPIVCLVAGFFKKSSRLFTTAYAMAQAGLLGWFFSSFYKFFTGRSGPPEHFLSERAVDISRAFHFGLGRGGIFWGWPSSHTTTAFAVSCAVFMLYPRSKPLRVLALLYACYVGLGVSMSIHWFSDFVMGAILGSLIGIAVGKSFYEKIISQVENPEK